MLYGLPAFYKEVLEAWGDFLTNVKIVRRGREQLLNQPLFLNCNIAEGNNTIYFKKMVGWRNQASERHPI